jgi:hypothetical protein
MLIDNKFIYLSLPRCASTAFYYTCILNDIKVEHTTKMWSNNNSKVDFKSIDEFDIMNHIQHGHETIIDLQNKFGIKYPTIAVKRERHERFYSLYKHTLFDFKRVGLNNFYDVFSKLSLNELFFFTKDDVLTQKTRWNAISNKLFELNLIDKKIELSDKTALKTFTDGYWKSNINEYAINVLDILITPLSFWTNNNNNIIWFEFNDFSKINEWVSDKLNKSFTLQSINSSKHINCNINLDLNFIKKYDDIYDYYDLPKSTKTLI